MSDECNKGEQAIDAQASEVTGELSDKDLEEVAGGAAYTQQKRQDGTAAGNVVAKWSTANGVSG
jgi:hypothetical protein